MKSSNDGMTMICSVCWRWHCPKTMMTRQEKKECCPCRLSCPPPPPPLELSRSKSLPLPPPIGGCNEVSIINGGPIDDDASSGHGRIIFLAPLHSSLTHMLPPGGGCTADDVHQCIGTSSKFVQCHQCLPAFPSPVNVALDAFHIIPINK